MDMDTIDAIEGAQTHIKNQEKYSEKLEDLILDGQEAKMQQQEINDKLKDLVGNESDDEEVDVRISLNSGHAQRTHGGDQSRQQEKNCQPRDQSQCTLLPKANN